MPDSIGQRLKQAREERNLSIEKVEELTRIRAHYLRALESDDYSSMSSAAQARGFLRNYSGFLGLDIDEILLELQRAQPAAEAESLSGPFPKLDAAAPLPEQPQEEKTSPPFWTSLLARFQKSESAPEAAPPESLPIEEPAPQLESSPVDQIAEAPPPVTEEPVIETPKKRGRKKTIYTAEPIAPTANTDERAKELLVEVPVPVVIEEQPDELIAEESQPLVAESRPETETPTYWARLKSLFIRAQKPDAEEIVAPQVGEVKAEGENPLVEAKQVEVTNEADEESKAGWSRRVSSLFRIRMNRPAREEEIAEHKAEAEPEPVAPQPDLPKQSAEEIFAGIGVELRKRREMISLTMDEVERHTHLRAAFLKALEAGDFDKLPSPVQTRGMLANYAQFLDLDADALLLKFADAIQARHRAKYPDKPAGFKPPAEVVSSLPPLRSFIAGDLLFGIAIVAILFGLAIWGVQSIIAAQTTEQALPAAPSIPQVLAEITQPAASEPPPQVLDTPLAIDTQDVTALPTFDANISVQVNIAAVERAFVRVIVDGNVKFDGRVLPGDILPFEARSQIEVLTGNASALRVTYNGRDLGLMGGFGEVVDRVYTAAGIATPTATLPPTPTNTPPATATLSVTQTPLPGPTITVTP